MTRQGKTRSAEWAEQTAGPTIQLSPSDSWGFSVDEIMVVEMRWLKWANFDPVLQFRSAETEGQLYLAEWKTVEFAHYPSDREDYERKLAGDD